MSTTPPPGWYPDHEAPAGHVRYWDGLEWTEDRSLEPVRRGHEVRALRPWVDRFVAVLVVTGVVVAVAVVFDKYQAPVHEAGPQARKAGRLHPASAPDGTAAPDPTRAPAPESQSAQPQFESGGTRTYEIASVLDGETLRLDNGVRVRLVGIDAPRAGQCGSEKAVRFLTRLVRGERVALNRPGADKDGEGRLLRYVVIGRTDVGLRMVRSGLVVAQGDSHDGLAQHPRQGAYVRAEAKVPDARTSACETR